MVDNLSIKLARCLHFFRPQPAPRGLFHGTMPRMTAPAPRLQFTSIRTRIVDGKPLIGLKQTAKAAGNQPVSTAWVEMTSEDAARLIKSLQETLAELR